jgi:hypothetical protein
MEELVRLDKQIEEADAEARDSLRAARYSTVQYVDALGDMLTAMGEDFFDDGSIGNAVIVLIEDVAPYLTDEQRNRIAKAVMTVDTEE